MIKVYTSTPKALLKAIYEKIDDKEIKTWSYDEKKDFTHANTQWEGYAWLRPSIKEGLLEFGIVGTNGGLSRLHYAIYHGRFTEMLLNHFDHKISDIKISSLAVCPPDILK